MGFSKNIKGFLSTSASAMETTIEFMPGINSTSLESICAGTENYIWVTHLCHLSIYAYKLLQLPRFDVVFQVIAYKQSYVYN